MDQRREDPRGALVRPYAVTRGRTEPRQDIAHRGGPGRQPGRVAGGPVRRARQAPHRHALRGRAQSLAEIAARTRLPLGVARVLVADMVADGLLSLHSAAPEEGFDGADGSAGKGVEWTSQALSGRGAAPKEITSAKIVVAGRLRRGQDDPGRRGLGDRRR